MITKNVVDRLADDLHDKLRKLFYDLRKEVMKLKNVQERLIASRSYRDFKPGYFIKNKELFHCSAFSGDSFLVTLDITNKLEHFIVDEQGMSQLFIEQIQETEDRDGMKKVQLMMASKKDVKSLVKIIALKHRLFLGY